MEPIHVPAPPKQAFNKNRRISDLIRAQVTHLKHVEAGMPATLRRVVPQHQIATEAEAAQYIASMTNLFKSQATNAPVPIKPAPQVITKPATPISTKPALFIAASASAPKKKAAPKKAKAPAKPKSRKK